MGRGVGPRHGGARVRGARQHELGLRVHARAPRRGGHAGRGGRAHGRPRPRDRPAGLRRPRERVRRRARGRCPRDHARGRSGSGRRLDRGLRPGRPHLRARPRGRAGRGGRGGGTSLDFPFTLTARAENHIRGNPDLEDTIARLQAFEEAGADVLYAPGLRTADEIRAVCEAVSRSRSTSSRCRA